jgi:hypothetical protein
MYALQKCIRRIDGAGLMAGDMAVECGGMVKSTMKAGGWGWKDPKECWKKTKNCLSRAVYGGASEATCVVSQWFSSCQAGFVPR